MIKDERGSDADEARRAAARRRQARYRARGKARKLAHDADDHSLCRPGECDALPVPVQLDAPGLNEGPGDAGEDVTGDVTSTPENSASHREPPAGLRERGLRLWNEMAGLKLSPAHVLLLERTCRQADRCDRFDEQLESRDWLELVEVPGTAGGVVRVLVDRVLAELRQTEIAMKLGIAELRHAVRPATASTRPPVGEKPEGVTEGAKRGGLAAIRYGVDAARG